MNTKCSRSIETLVREAAKEPFCNDTRMEVAHQACPLLHEAAALSDLVCLGVTLYLHSLESYWSAFASHDDKVEYQSRQESSSQRVLASAPPRQEAAVCLQEESTGRQVSSLATEGKRTS